MNSEAGKGGHELVATNARFTSGWTDDALTSVTYTKALDGRVAVITLSRPKQRNAWTEIMRNEVCEWGVLCGDAVRPQSGVQVLRGRWLVQWQGRPHLITRSSSPSPSQVARCLDEASRDPTVRVSVLTGDPAGKAFCAGADLSPGGPTNPTSMQGDVPEGRPADLGYWRDGGGTAGLAIMRSTKPVICAINGAAVGVGMTLPLACDITVAAEGAKVGFVFGKRGLTMECLSSYMLEKCVGHKVAMELVLTGRIMRAEDEPGGLFNYVVPRDEVMSKVLGICAVSSHGIGRGLLFLVEHGARERGGW